MRGHGGSDDRAALRAAARKAHETNAESQYPKWNEHTDQQFKLMKKHHEKRAYRSDSLEHYLIFTFFPDLKKYQTVDAIRKARKKAAHPETGTSPRSPRSGTRAAAIPAAAAIAAAAAIPGAAAAQPAAAAAGDAASPPPAGDGHEAAGEGGGAAGAGGAAGEGGGDGGNSIRIVEGPPSRSVAARAAADDDEGEKEAEKSEAEKSNASSSETGAESRKSKEKPKKKVAAGRSSGADSQARQKRKATIVKDTVATESDDNAEPKKKLRRRSSKGDANKDDNGGDLEKPKRTSRHFSKNDSPISLEFKSFDAILSKFQQRIWARDGYYRKEGAIDRKLNLLNLLLVAEENYSKKTYNRLKAAFDRAMDDPAEQ